MRLHKQAGTTARTREKGKMSDKRIKVGDTVKWRSAASGVWKEKVGVVAEVVKSEDAPDRDRFISLYKGGGIGCYRGHESYVVEVRGPRGGVKYYWPRVSALEVVR
jgi:hypothetical protein